jgi:Ca2+-binding EF-hand superfamily protein
MNNHLRFAMGILLLVLAAASTGSTRGAGPDLPEDVFAPMPGDDLQDLLFLADDRPLFLRLHIRVGDTGFRSMWNDFIGRLYRYLDGDNDGVLTVAEAQRGNWQQMVQGIRVGTLAGVTGARATLFDSDPKDGKVSLVELARYVRGTMSYDELGIQPGPAPDPRSQALFAQLDTDQDGTLAPAELTADVIDRCLARLDLNEDELLDLTELKPFENIYADRLGVVPAQPAARDPDELVLLGPATVGPRLFQRLIVRYDRAAPGAVAADNRLSAAELGCSQETLRRFDADGDGVLDQDEVMALLARPVPDVELDVVLGRGGAKGPAIHLAGMPRYPIAHPPGPRGTTPRPALTVDTRDVALEVAVDDNLASGNELLLRQFDQADSDGNGYVDKQEGMRVVLVQRVFVLADRDGDGKLYRKELEDYIERQADAIASRIMLRIADHGRTLVALLDADGDQRLSLRELRRARSRLAQLDRDGDGRIALSEIPRQYRLGIGRGQTPVRVVTVVKAYTEEEPRNTTPTAGPVWFDRMDRNRDGDVSAREFLGTRAQFREFDADGDGLIDAREARGRP